MKSRWVVSETLTELWQLLLQTGTAMMKHKITGFLSSQENISSNHYREHQVEISVCVMGSPSQFQNQCCSTISENQERPAALIVS